MSGPFQGSTCSDLKAHSSITFYPTRFVVYKLVFVKMNKILIMLQNNIIIYKLCCKKMKIEGTKWVMISRKLRERQYKKKKKERKMQWLTKHYKQKLKLAQHIPLIIWVLRKGRQFLFYQRYPFCYSRQVTKEERRMEL